MWYTPSSARKTWLALALSTPTFLIAAEKNRDWQMGQIVESKVADPKIHSIATATKTYVVRGSIGYSEDELPIGSAVRFALQGATMYLSIEGNEFKLSVLGATVRTAAPPVPGQPPGPGQPPVPARPATPPQPAPPPLPAAPAPSVTSARPSSPAQSEPALDNDAVVKMIVGGLKEDTVVSVIEARPGKYALSPDAMAALRTAGVPQSVIAAMSAKMSAQH
jgi:hypothetical protein